ncbi:VOC family protein [Trinickia sp.]|uniref:VOC family protein n=1 Tax=Trinickia sp. TaxID=2571163 RepID=UPI003F7DE4E7
MSATHVKAIPEGFHTVTPYITASDANAVIEFLQRAFDATLVERIDDEKGRIRHAQVKVGDSFVMLTDGNDDCTPAPASFYLYLNDVDAAYARALRAGGESIMEPADQFYGDRNAGVRDASGNTWWLATHIEDVPSEEIARRARAAGNT